MRRFAVCIVAFSAVIIGSAASCAIAEDSFCPPGAKYCPAPGAGQTDMFPDQAGSFGPRSPAADQFAAFQSQLNEGETLIMVAPTVDMSGTPAEIAPFSAPMMQAQYPASSLPAGAFAAAPAPAGMPGDFMPPPPGSLRNSPPAAAPAAPVSRTYPRELAQTFRNDELSRPVAAPVRRPLREPAPAGETLALSRDGFNRDRPAAKPAGKPKRTDMLSEVANETSRKNPKSAVKKSSSRDRDGKSPAKKDAARNKKDTAKRDKRDRKERMGQQDRVPWWKGGLWRNRKR